jgi:hypothetical protein
MPVWAKHKVGHPEATQRNAAHRSGPPPSACVIRKSEHLEKVVYFF